MSGWLNQLEERCRLEASLSASLSADQIGYVVLDQRRSTDQCRSLLDQPGRRDFITLFAGTALSRLNDASPWLLEIEVGSDAWQCAETLCQQRLGWMCQPPAAQTLQTIANHLRTSFVMDDPHGGQSLINLQQPAVWTALLASAPANIYSHWLSSLSQVATPTPQGQWFIWQADAPTSPAPDRLQITADMESALSESQQAWWLSHTTHTALAALPIHWMTRVKTVMEAGITRSDHLRRLLPIITDERETLHAQIDGILNQQIPSRQKVQQLERLL